ncbi:MAG TPA: dihydrodipicolinate reductase C-terminal domain-containing protein [Holophagaceae bacterium]|jgi:4-hydroxy-tetrahydrodipicolinate reductase|nr:dihydrodipicolinate reductase C-terminal domain-containing protein [Holophagaceae bacterium]
MRIGVFGRGRLGSAVAEAAGDRLAWQVGREAPPDEEVDAAIEASAAAAVPARLEWAIATGTPLLIGTTGWSIPDLETKVKDRIGVLVAPNFSLTMALYARLSLVLARFAALDETWDPYLVEHHHARKHDAPSGTAKQLAATLLKGCPRKTEWTIPAMGAPLAPHQLNVSSIRAGHTYSAHTVGLDAPGETLELIHAARSARPYAEGALRAAAWIRGRKGLFTMDDVARDLLDPLFREVNP